jgi:uncharacterized damage-inducible protein DinB
MWLSATLDQDSFDLAPPGEPPHERPKLSSRKQILERFDQAAAAARASLAKATDEHLMKPWSLLNGGKTIMTMPRIACVRSFVLNHNVHHRAQLGVYLRLNNIPVPAIYGPSADEGAM